MTLKQKLFAKKYVNNGGNATKAAFEVYNGNYESAKSQAYQNLRKPEIQKEISKQLDDAGLSLDRLNNVSEKIVSSINPSFIKGATGVNHLQFLYKLHNVLPINKSMHMSLNKTEQLPSKDMIEIKQLLTKMNENTNKILQDLNK